MIYLKLNNPYFIENIYTDQPYSSMLLIAPNCDFKCKNCQNKHLFGNVQDISIDILKNEYYSNPFFEGITIGGLEMFLSGDEFLQEIIDFIKLCDIKKVTLYTRFDINDEFVIKFLNELKKINIDELYIKYGEYIENSNKKIIEINNWKIILASDNQNFIKIN